MITDRDPEFRDTITALYQEELGRAPDPGGLASWLANCRNGMTGEQLRAALHDAPEAVAYRSRPPVPIAPPLPSLDIQGIDFVQAGRRVVLNGTDQFRAYRQFLDGEDLSPLFQESAELGFVLWRVFLQGSKAQNGVLELRPSEPHYYETLRSFAELLNQHGIVPLATVFVDNQDINAGGAEHFARVAEALRGTRTLLSGGNEWTKNGFLPGVLADPGMVWSRGSNVGDVAPFQPSGSFLEFHPRRDLPAALMDTVASAVYIRTRDPKPLIIDEPPRMGTDGSGPEYADPFVCWKFARHYATECAGAIFHSRAGQQGVVMDGNTRACAAAWSKGMMIE
jgi:hypothetical protein